MPGAAGDGCLGSGHRQRWRRGLWLQRLGRRRAWLSTSGAGIHGESGGDGVYGHSTATAYGYGVHGESNGIGVYGHSAAAGDGVYGATEATASAGVYGQNGGSGVGYGVIGQATGSTSYGVYGESDGAFGTGVLGSTSTQSGTGVSGVASSGGFAVNGTATSGGWGVYGAAWGTGGTAVTGMQNTGAAWAGFFSGDVKVTGTFTSPAPIIQLDHPDAPADRYYQRAPVGAFELLSVVCGSAITGADGKVTVRVPVLFARFHVEVRYQLTVIGKLAAVYVASKLDAKGGFTIASDVSGLEVSWQLTGVRSDPAALKQPLRVDVAKPARYRGRYIQPTLYGQPRSKSLVAPRPAPRHPKAPRRVR